MKRRERITNNKNTVMFRLIVITFQALGNDLAQEAIREYGQRFLDEGWTDDDVLWWAAHQGLTTAIEIYNQSQLSAN